MNEKRSANFAGMLRRQTSCATQCSSIAAAAACNSSECICPIYAAAGATEIKTCVDCLQPIEPYLASNITFSANVCSMCDSQCSAALTAYIQSLSCNSTTCLCSVFSVAGATAITTCANCIKPFDPTDAAGALALAQECGIISPVSVSSSASVSGSSSTSGPSTTGPTASTRAASSSASAVATASTSAGNRVNKDLYQMLFWLPLLVFGFLWMQNPFLVIGHIMWK